MPSPPTAVPVAAGPLARAMAAARAAIEPWYLAYFCLGLMTSGMLPVLLPLLVARHSGRLGDVAYVIGGYNLGLLSAPLIGALAERYRLYRTLFFAGFALAGLGLGAAARVSDMAAWIPLAIAIGAGTAAATVVASLFVLDFAAQDEWETRIGWLQSFSGAGQVVGLLMAGIFSDGRSAEGLFIAALFTVPALVFGRIGLPDRRSASAGSRARAIVEGRPGGAEPGAPAGVQPAPLALAQPIREPGRHGAAATHAHGPALGGLHHQAHRVHGASLASLPGLLRMPFGRFLMSWFAYNFGVAAFFAYFPLLMRQSYGVSPSTTAFAYAVAAGIGIFLFILAGGWSKRYGAPRLYRFALLLRIAGFVLLYLLLLTHLPMADKLALLGFAMINLAWPLLSVSGTGLTARLTPIGEGAAIGLLSATGAMATVLGTFAGGPLVHFMGYGSTLLVGVLGLGVAALLVGGVPNGSDRGQGANQ
jgi:MFS family permease